MVGYGFLVLIGHDDRLVVIGGWVWMLGIDWS